ncbi:MAG TPA: NUDIX hydrolase [Planctomycetota bacterium]|nr:NUDIX hydrolase [Planctomycetota bacterium]
MPFCYDFPRPMVTVDVAVFAPPEAPTGPARLLLIRRGKPPFAGRWALPGGFLDLEEELDDAARRELREETGLHARRLVQLGAYGKRGRDPRGRTISVVFLAAADAARRVRAGDDAGAVAWHSVAALPRLAFDHAHIVRDALARMRELARRPEAFARTLFGSRPPAFAARLRRALHHA